MMQDRQQQAQLQQALVLEDVQKFALRELPIPTPGNREVLIQVGAVGICGTDLHIFHGLANYCRDSRGLPIPLSSKPQVLGHEFCGWVAAVGNTVRRCKAGDLVAVDQFLSCTSLNRPAPCEYCESGDTHQCEFGQELGISGLPGAFSQFVVVPEANVLVLPPQFDVAEGALIEPLGCVIHACNRLEKAGTRYSLNGHHRIRRMLILGLGPSGLLFVQYLRNVIGFDGELFAADLQETKLELAAQFGASSVNVRNQDLVSEIQTRTGGKKLDCVIEATGSGSVFDEMPALLRRQATVLFYGAGHSGRDIGCLTPFQAAEVHLVTSGGASGGFDSDGNPSTYRAAMQAIHDGRIEVSPLISHRYQQLVELEQAFVQDFRRPEYIKGIFTHPNRQDHLGAGTSP
jgi:threonine dehydrogenase-like Zn-dependent dehydrogenase